MGTFIKRLDRPKLDARLGAELTMQTDPRTFLFTMGLSCARLLLRRTTPPACQPFILHSQLHPTNPSLCCKIQVLDLLRLQWAHTGLFLIQWVHQVCCVPNEEMICVHDPGCENHSRLHTGPVWFPITHRDQIWTSWIMTSSLFCRTFDVDHSKCVFWTDELITSTRTFVSFRIPQTHTMIFSPCNCMWQGLYWQPVTNL